MTPPTTTPTSVINEESSSEAGVDFGGTWPSNRKDWKKRQLRRAQPARLLKENTTNGVHGRQDVTVCTKGESTRNIPINKELLQEGAPESTDINEDFVGAVDHMIKTVVTPPNTDPLHRRATRGTDDEKGVASAASKHTNHISLTPVHTRSKSKGHEVDEPDGGLGSYIAQLRARGHQRSTSAPIRDRITDMSANVVEEAVTSDEVESKRADALGERKVIEA